MKHFVKPWSTTTYGKMKPILAGEFLLAFLDAMCYSDLRWMLPLQLLMIPFVREWERFRKKRLKRQYALGFQEVLQSLMTSIQAGYTLENALKGVLPELLEHREERGDPTVEQMRRIVLGLELGIPVEQLFLRYAVETENEDIMEFAGVMEIVRFTGGNLVMILKKTMDNFQKKMDTEEEIRVILSGVVYEKNIMLCMPLIIFIYMRFTSPSYMGYLWHSTAGHILMTGVLFGITAIYYWTEDILKIRV